MAKTNIRWAHSTVNFYGWRCTKIAPECENCYMFTLAERYGKGNAHIRHSEPMPTRFDKAVQELAKVPAGQAIFVNSMSDTYHHSASVADIARIHALAAANPHVVFLVLTKRPNRAKKLEDVLVWPDNLWIGTSVGTEKTMHRLDSLLSITAAKGHFLSAEPLLEPLPSLAQRLATGDLPLLSWLITGAESGASRRPFDKAWVRPLRDAAAAAGVPFFFKQGSAFRSEQDYLLDGREHSDIPDWTAITQLATMKAHG